MQARTLLRLILTFGLLLLPTSMTAAQGETAQAEVNYGNHHAPLKHARQIISRGHRSPDGTCRFPIPRLELAPEETAIVAYKRSANFNDCTAVFDVGEPTDTDMPHGGETLTVATHPHGKPQTSDVSAQATSSGYYRAYWHDPIHAPLNEVKSNITWNWNGSCVTSASGSADYWHLFVSGWTRTSNGVWQTNGCSSTGIYADATFSNSLFCNGVTVTTMYDNVSVYGHANGAISGYTNFTTTQYQGRSPYPCPSLHDHYELRKVSG